MATESLSRSAAPEPAVQIIQPISGWASLELRELWSYRELLWTFTWRNILVRYKQTVLGFLWAIWEKDKRTWHDLMVGTRVVSAE